MEAGDGAAPSTRKTRTISTCWINPGGLSLKNQGRQLHFTFPSAPDPLFKASKAPFLTLRVATPSGAPRQAPLDHSRETPSLPFFFVCVCVCMRVFFCNQIPSCLKKSNNSFFFSSCSSEPSQSPPETKRERPLLRPFAGYILKCKAPPPQKGVFRRLIFSG